MLAGVVFTAILVIAAIGDLKTRRIPNRIVALLAVLGLAFTIAQNPVLTAFARAGGGLLVGLLFWLPFYAFGWLGAGDVKLYAAAGAWLGPMRALDGALVGAVSGGILSIIWLIRLQGVRESMRTLSMAAATPRVLSQGAAGEGKRSTLPYGVAIAVGALCAGWLPRLIFS
jgi:prepilin peptidase CpaA